MALAAMQLRLVLARIKGRKNLLRGRFGFPSSGILSGMLDRLYSNVDAGQGWQVASKFHCTQITLHANPRIAEG
jgi:hypothetical protein